MSPGSVELTSDPALYVGGPVADVFADPESGRANAGIAPGIEGGNRHVEVVGELPGGEKPIQDVHAPDPAATPVVAVSETLSNPFI